MSETRDTRHGLVHAAVNVVVVMGIVLALLALNRAFATGTPGLVPDPLTLAWLAAGSVLLAAATAATWRQCLHGVARRRVSIPDAVAHTAFMLVGKYVPGKVWGIALRALASRRYGLTAEMMMKGSLLELAVAVQSALLIGLPVYLFHARPAAMAAVVAGLLPASYLLFRFGVRALDRLGGRVPWLRERLAGAMDGLDPGPRAYFVVLGWFCLQWGLICTIVLALLATVHADLPPHSLAAVAAAYPLSVIVGFAAVFAPGGLGVREGTFVGLLLPVLPAQAAIDLALVLRLWNVAFDFAVGLAGYGLFVHRARRGDLPR